MDAAGEEEGLLQEPLMADQQEGFAEFPFDEALLKELAALDAAEAGGPLDGMSHVEDEDVYKMKELIREKPKDVIQYLEEEGVVKLGEFDIQDAIAFRAFEKDSMLTMGTDHYEVDWETMWRERLAEYARPQEVKSALGWSTKVTVEAHVVNLRDAAAEGSRGLLHPLLKRFHAHACSPTVFALPAVQAVINFKWTSWARQFLLYELACYSLWLGLFTAFTLLFQVEDWTMPLWQAIQDRAGFLSMLCSILSLVPMSAFLYMELCTIAAYGWGWVRAWNIMDMASYILQVVIVVLHLQRTWLDEGWFSILIATQQVLLWMKLHYFAKSFNPGKTNNLIDIIRIVMEDMKWFLIFLGLTMVGFGLAFYALFRQDRSFPDFANIWHSFASMFSYMLAMFDYNVFYGSTNPTAAMLLFIAFEFVFNVLLLNVLIASMTNSLSKVTQDEGLRLLHSKAEIIDELEATLPQWVRSRTWYPHFVQILKIHPDATYEVNLNSVWSGIGLMENNLLGANQETRLRVEELEDRMNKLHKKLDVLIKLFISSLGPSHALSLSRQATLGQHGAAAAAAAAGGVVPGAGAGGSFGSGIRSSLQAPSPHWQQGRGHNPDTPHGPGFLRHAMSALVQLPEQLAAVSGPLLPLGAQQQGGAGTGAQRGMTRQSGPSGLWSAAALGGAATPTLRSTGSSRTNSGTGGVAAAAAASRGSRGSSGLVGRHAAEQHSPGVDDLRGSSFSGVSGSSTGQLYTVGSSHIGPMLSQVQALQLLNQQQQMGPYAAVQAGRGQQAPNATRGLKRSNSL